MYKYNNKDDDKELYGQQPEQPADGGTNDGDNVQTDEAQQQQPQQQRKFSTYDDILSYMRDKGVSDEDRKRIEKRNKTNAIIAGISDLGSSLANLYFTTKGAPNAYNPKAGMSAKAQERYDKALADFDQNRAWHLNYAQRLANAKAADDQRAFNREQLEEAKKEKEAAKRLAEVNADADAYANKRMWSSHAAADDLDYDNESKLLADAYSNGDIPEDIYNARQHNLDAVFNAAKTKRNYERYKADMRQKNGRGSGGSGSGGNYYEYVAGYLINKNDYKSAINEGYQAIPERFRSWRDKSLDDQHKAISEFLNNPNISEAEKQPVREQLQGISRRKTVTTATKPAQQQKKTDTKIKTNVNWQ